MASVYRFCLCSGTAKRLTPPAFVTEQADWKPGDGTDAEVEAAGMVLFHAIWTVEPLEE